jgi:hypothetical protein
MFCMKVTFCICIKCARLHYLFFLFKEIIITKLFSVAWLQAGRSDDRGSSPGGGWGFFRSTPCPNRLWGSPNLLSNWYQGLFPWEWNGRDVKLTAHLHLVPRSGNAWSVSPLPRYIFIAWCLVKQSRRQPTRGGLLAWVLGQVAYSEIRDWSFSRRWRVKLRSSGLWRLEFNVTKCYTGPRASIAYGEIRNAYKISVWKPEGKRPLWRPSCGWETNNRMGFIEAGLEGVK